MNDKPLDRDMDKLCKSAAMTGFQYARACPTDSQKDFERWWNEQFKPAQQSKIKTKRSIKAR